MYGLYNNPFLSHTPSICMGCTIPSKISNALYVWRNLGLLAPCKVVLNPRPVQEHAVKIRTRTRVLII